MNKQFLALSLCVIVSFCVLADGKKKPPSLAGKTSSKVSSEKSSKASEVSKSSGPSLARRAELPPGLEKKFGKKRPEVAYVAFDPKRKDQAWLLIEGEWKLETDFDAALEKEVKASLSLPISSPPVPLPKTDAKLRVVKFE